MLRHKWRIGSRELQSFPAIIRIVSRSKRRSQFLILSAYGELNIRSVLIDIAYLILKMLNSLAHLFVFGLQIMLLDLCLLQLRFHMSRELELFVHLHFQIVQLQLFTFYIEFELMVELLQLFNYI